MGSCRCIKGKHHLIGRLRTPPTLQDAFVLRIRVIVSFVFLETSIKESEPLFV